MDRLDERAVNEAMRYYRVDRLTAEFILALKAGRTDGDLVMVGGDDADRRRLGAGMSIMDHRADEER